MNPYLQRENIRHWINDGGIPDDGKIFKENLVCIVSNSIFDAAGYAYDPNEYLAFKYPDGRPRKWLVHPMARKLSGYKEINFEK